MGSGNRPVCAQPGIPLTSLSAAIRSNLMVRRRKYRVRSSRISKFKRF
ncbi:hypothetical protein PATSB16_21390 [Pandoraea thiooxydans]|nr:hypothetical protein PATSB16_21390 [Pandoraea thiooxydans]